jgi:hypothetical protein
MCVPQLPSKLISLCYHTISLNVIFWTTKNSLSWKRASLTLLRPENAPPVICERDLCHTKINENPRSRMVRVVYWRLNLCSLTGKYVSCNCCLFCPFLQNCNGGGHDKVSHCSLRLFGPFFWKRTSLTLLRDQRTLSSVSSICAPEEQITPVVRVIVHWLENMFCSVHILQNCNGGGHKASLFTTSLGLTITSSSLHHLMYADLQQA